jgi:RNA polymerase sigma factor (sigma-70 family)
VVFGFRDSRAGGNRQQSQFQTLTSERVSSIPQKSCRNVVETPWTGNFSADGFKSCLKRESSGCWGIRRVLRSSDSPEISGTCGDQRKSQSNALLTDFVDVRLIVWIRRRQRLETRHVSSVSPQAIFLEHESWLRTVVRSRVSEADAVEDVMQNIALAIVKHRSMLAEVNKVGAWLYQIAVRQVLMYRRTSGRRRKMQDRLAADTSVRTETESPLISLMAAESQETVQKALGQLSELDRQILMLKYAEGWSYRDLSEHLGVQEDTIEYRLLRARRNLRRLLRDYVEEGAIPC